MSLRVALPEAGVSHLQLGSEAQTTVSPFFLMYLYSMTVLAVNVTVPVHPYPVSKTPQKTHKHKFVYSPLQVG